MQHKWMNEAYRNSARCLIRLLGGAMNARDPGVILPDCDEALSLIADIAGSNGVDGLAFCAFQYMPQPPEGDIYDRMKKGWEKTCYRQLSFDAEREEIMREMKKQGVSCLPLKGILLAAYYPEPGMRYMGDNDILYGFTSVSESGQVCLAGANADEIAANAACAFEILSGIMKARGYDFIAFDESIHDSFTKKPFFCFEMHRALFTTTNKYGFYYADPWSRAIVDDDGCYRFSNEDEYIYNLVHAVRHAESAGTGIRFFTDIYILLKKNGSGLDWEYITRELTILGLVQIEERLRKIALTAFDDPDSLTEEQEEELFFYMGCGMYGTVEARTNIFLDRLKEDKGTGILRLRYIKSRLFLPDDVEKRAFPKLYENRFLRPFIPLYRVWSAMIKRPKVLFSEIRELLFSRDKH